MHVPLALALTLSLICACAERSPAVEPVFAGGKTDVADRIDVRGSLAYDAPVTGDFAEDLDFHGYLLDAAPGAVVTLDVTHLGSSSKLDTTLFVYGPQDEAGGYGTAALLFDDDSSWGRLSRLRDVALDDGGRYLVVLGTHDGRGRGHYRFVASCESGDCAPAPEACPAPFADAVNACTDEILPEHWNDVRHAAEQCADAEPLAVVFDQVCAAPGAPSYCDSFEDFFATAAPACASQAYDRILDGRCVLGGSFYELLRQDHLIVTRHDWITDADDFTALERDQAVSALHASIHEDVTTAEEALERVDQNEIRVVELWDASAARGFTALEYGSGDSSYGKVFAAGSTDLGAEIQDGDLYDCAATFGDAQRDCRSDDDCRGDLGCYGIAPETGLGQCVDLAPVPGAGVECDLDVDCGDGLVCAGTSRDFGFCGPAWSRGRFEARADQPIPDGSPAGAQSQVVAYGLTTVDTDVWLTLPLDHPAYDQLRITLTNPAGTEVVVHDGEATDVGIEFPVTGFSGDEEVNGVWTLSVIDQVSGGAGRIDDWTLRVGSRFD